MKQIHIIIALLTLTLFAISCQPQPVNTVANILPTPSATPDPRTEIEKAVKEYLASNNGCEALRGISLQQRGMDTYFVTFHCEAPKKYLDYLIAQKFSLTNRSYWSVRIISDTEGFDRPGLRGP